MTLSIPNRKKPGKNSFPTKPDGVQQWLSSLVPLNSMENVRSLYRGLKHSNRLETSNQHRIDIADLFSPVVDDATLWLRDQFADQSLPLPKKSKLCFQLVTELLRELAFTYKIIVSDTYSSLLPGPSRDRSSAIFRALNTLAQLIECHLSVHMLAPPQVLRDANTLYGFALKSKLTGAISRSTSVNPDNDLSIEKLYIYVQLLSLSSPYNIRQRQIPLLCRYLAKQCTKLTLQQSLDAVADKNYSFSIHLEQDCRPQLLRYTGVTQDSADILLLDTKPLIDNIDRTINRTSNTTNALFEAETLSKSTLSELRESLVRERDRKSSRAILRKQMYTKTGIKEITASLHYNPLNIPLNPDFPTSSFEPTDYWPSRPVNQERVWTVINENRLGACLEWSDGGTTDSEVGEVVALRQVNAGVEEPWVIGFVRWIRLIDLDRVQLGIKYFAKNAEPVAANNRDAGALDISRDCLLARFNSNDMELTSLIAPPLAFHESELIQTGENSQHQLNQKIASTPMCDVFIVNEVPMPARTTSTELESEA